MKRLEKKIYRLNLLEQILVQSFPQGLKKAELAREIDVNRSQIPGYLADLSRQNIIVFENDDGRVCIDPSTYKMTLKFDQNECVAVFLAIRLLTTRTDKRYPSAAGALREIGQSFRAVAPFISKHILGASKLVEHNSRKENMVFISNLEKLTLAWAEQKKVKLVYETGKTHVFSMYFIEPYALGNTMYVIGESEKSAQDKKILTLKLERILSVEIIEESYVIPETFDPTKVLEDTWGIWGSDSVAQDVILKFSPEVRDRVLETQWHVSEVKVLEKDGFLLWQATISEPREMLPWIRGWGADCEVLAPKALRSRVMEDVEKMGRVYGKSK